MFEDRIQGRLPEAGIDKRRRSGRDSLFLLATIGKPGQPESELSSLRVRNLSQVGLMADYRDPATPGEAVVVTIRGLGEIPGKVAWVRTGQIGVTFDVEINPKKARRPLNSQAAASWNLPG